jgi:hypothetical protein
MDKILPDSFLGDCINLTLPLRFPLFVLVIVKALSLCWSFFLRCSLSSSCRYATLFFALFIVKFLPLRCPFFCVGHCQGPAVTLPFFCVGHCQGPNVTLPFSYQLPSRVLSFGCLFCRLPLRVLGFDCLLFYRSPLRVLGYGYFFSSH